MRLYPGPNSLCSLTTSDIIPKASTLQSYTATILCYDRQAKEHNQDFKRWDNMDKVFISYSRKDIAFANKLAGDLEKAGYDVWWDITDLRGGDDWVNTIPIAIADSRYIIVVLTPSSIESEWVRKEYTQALSLRKKIIPIMLASCSVPFALNTINFVNFTSGEYADNFKRLLSPLGYTGKPPEVMPFNRTAAILSSTLRKYAIPIIIGIVLLLAFTWKYLFTPPPDTPTPTPSQTATPTATFTLEPTSTFSPTASPTITVSPTKPTATASPTKQTFPILRFCINVLLDVHNINVRSGPGTAYAVLGAPLDVDACLNFRALNEDETWLLIAPDQSISTLEQYAGGWIRRDLLGLGQSGPVGLPVVTLTPTPTSTSTSTITPSYTPSSTPTITPSPTVTYTPTATSTYTSTPTNTSTVTPSQTPTATETTAP